MLQSTVCPDAFITLSKPQHKTNKANRRQEDTHSPGNKEDTHQNQSVPNQPTPPSQLAPTRVGGNDKIALSQSHCVSD